MITTVGQLAVNMALPEEMRDWNRVLDGKGVTALFQQIAEQHPDKYREIAKKLSDIGRDAAYTTGGFSFGLKHLRQAQASKQFRQRMANTMTRIMNDKTLTDSQKEQAILQFAEAQSKPLEQEIMQESQLENNPLALQINSKARGNPGNLRSLRGADILYVDHHDRRIPIPVVHSYAEGLTPAEYWAGTYGARKGVHDVKKCLFSDTLVLMADWTERRICDIQPGDMVMGADFSGKFIPVRVVRRFDNGLKPCNKYTFRVGSARERFVELVATDDHEILSEVRAGRPGSTYAYRSDYTPGLRKLGTASLLKNPTKNTFIACPARGSLHSSGMREPLSLLYGLLLGDGSCTSGWSLSCGDGQLISDIRVYLQQFNLTLTPPSQGYGWTFSSDVVYERTRDALGRVIGTGNPVLQRLEQLGVRHLAHEKQIAAEVDTWCQRDVASVIAGIFAADGCIDVRPTFVALRLFMTSKAIVEWVKRTLELRFGVWCGKLQYKPICGNMKNPQWGFVIGHQECVRAFADQIPLVGVKQRVLRTTLAALTPRPENTRIGFKIYSKEACGMLPTHDLEVDHPDHMFVLGNGLVVSNSVGDAGFLAKQLAQVSHRLVVTADDFDPETDGDDPDRQYVGLPVDVDDADSVGALLSLPVGGYARNTVITPKILQDIRRQGVKRILVRSPIAGIGPSNGGVFARDVGHREYGRLPTRGDMAGLTASQALAERLTQGSLSSKHSGGVAGAAGNAAVSGFKYINQLVQTPKQFSGGATHAQLDGRVQSITEAPQGGYYITIGEQQHYVATDLKPLVQPGQEVEAGDVLSEGIPNPAEITAHKHIGEGRRYFTKAFYDAYRNSGINGHRRNVELLSRGLVDHVRMTDELGDYNPDDVVPYSDIARSWQAREDSVRTPIRSAVGMYLEKPVLHHSIGTQIKSSMLNELRQFGVKDILVNKAPPPFKPVMIRAMGQMNHDPDFMTRFLGSNLQKSTLEAVHQGRSSDLKGTSYVSALAEGSSFGRPEKAAKPKLF